MGVVHVLDCLIPAFKSTGSGHIAIMGSTAGYRGLPRSAAYGPTKAALANLAEALYLDLEPYGIKVQMISPGFVETEATAVNDFKMPQIISAHTAATKIIKGLNRNQFEICFPAGFVWVMKLLSVLPHALYTPIIKWITK
jgi:short-subunit dehydrogenase